MVKKGCYILTFDSMLVVDFWTGYHTCVLGNSRNNRVGRKCVGVENII